MSHSKRNRGLEFFPVRDQENENLEDKLSVSIKIC